MLRLITCIVVLIMVLAVVSTAIAAEMEKTEAITPQTTCPVMGGGINKSLSVDHEGKRIYVCCPGCIEVVKKDPAKYIKQLEDEGITLAETPLQLCPKCGEIKGSEKCCKMEGREKCEKCGLLKGSPGCCKIPAGVTRPMDLCPKCGEIHGSKDCCNNEGKEMCPKCGLHKGSPGCCKMVEESKQSAMPAMLCPKCGEIKGSEKCCKMEGREICQKCGLLHGSPGCCNPEFLKLKKAMEDKAGETKAQLEEVKEKIPPVGAIGN
ncbi:MAG: hypothetical protein JXA52_02225 [Planctomycetes bacterium]|nr:hypothetical protein [Planctomycetota bacterium]